MENDQNLPKTFIVKIVQENHSQITIITKENNHNIEITIVEDFQIEEIQKVSQQTDIVDQTIKITNIEITTRDQFQIEVITQITMKWFPFKPSNIISFK